jgi:hypothetical protein
MRRSTRIFESDQWHVQSDELASCLHVKDNKSENSPSDVSIDNSLETYTDHENVKSMDHRHRPSRGRRLELYPSLELGHFDFGSQFNVPHSVIMVRDVDAKPG